MRPAALNGSAISCSAEDGRAVDADRHALALGLDRAGRGDRVLLAHDVEDLVDRHAQHGEPRVAELDVDLLVLHAEQVDLGDVGHAQQAQPRLLDHRLDLGVGEAVGLEGVDQAVGVAELVVEERADARPAAGVPLMSPIFLRTWYQRSGTLAGGTSSRSET